MRLASALPVVVRSTANERGPVPPALQGLGLAARELLRYDRLVVDDWQGRPVEVDVVLADGAVHVTDDRWAAFAAS